jgi:hypothetical protein
MPLGFAKIFVIFVIFRKLISRNFRENKKTKIFVSKPNRNRCWRAVAHPHINVLILHYVGISLRKGVGIGWVRNFAEICPKYRNFWWNIANSLWNSISQKKGGYESRFFISRNSKLIRYYNLFREIARNVVTILSRNFANKCCKIWQTQFWPSL